MTGAEAIQKILEDVGSLTSTVKDLADSIKLIEANIKVLNNRAAGLMREQPQVISSSVSNVESKQLMAEAPKQSTQPVSAPETERSNILTYKKVFGKLVNNTSEPIENVLIKIYDKNNEVCASTETDTIGYWETMLKPGRYIAEYLKTGFKTANKMFEVDKNSKATEVK